MLTETAKSNADDADVGDEADCDDCDADCDDTNIRENRNCKEQR